MMYHDYNEWSNQNTTLMMCIMKKRSWLRECTVIVDMLIGLEMLSEYGRHRCRGRVNVYPTSRTMVPTCHV